MDTGYEEDEKSGLLNKSHAEHDSYTSIDSVLQNGESVLSATDNSINQPKVIIERQSDIKIYKRRWYVLMMFCFVAAAQGGVWNTWGPISDSAKDAFGWTDADIGLLSNWGPITYLLSGIVFSWMVDVKGLRYSSLVTCFLIVAGCGFRCITSTPPWSTYLIHVGQFLNGFAGPVGMGAGPAVSATWFPPEERTTATAIATVLNAMGVAFSFIIGPYLVPYHSNTTLSNHSHYNFSVQESLNDDSFFVYNTHTNGSASTEAKEIKDIMFLMYIEFGATLALFLAMLVYFPSKPPLPPCLSASISRQDFKSGLKALFRCKQFWIVAFVYGSSLGVANAWTGIIDVLLSPLGIGQKEAGWLGFYATLAGSGAGIIIARFADKFSKHFKLFIICLYVVATGFIVWLSLACIHVVPSSTVILYVTVIISVMPLNACTPLLFELGCELAYPIGEGTANIMMTIMNNIGGLLFYFVLMVPSLGSNTVWMNWTLLGSVVICFPLLFIVKENYNRLELDEQKSVDSEQATI